MQKNRIFTLGTLRDYILENYPNLLWWDGNSKHQTWDGTKSFKHRQGMPNEIRIEFDGEDKNTNWEAVNLTAIKLEKLKYSFAIFSVDVGRSPHIHIYDLDELEQLNEEQRTSYRIQFLNKICPGLEPDLELCNEKHLCALEFVNHFKYNKPKQILRYFYNGMNMGIDSKIKDNILNKKTKKPTKKKTNNQKTLKLGDKIKRSSRDILINELTFEQVFDKYKISYRGGMAICPFHNDTNGSLSFTNSKGLWNCFGCHEKGDIITLIKLLEEKNGNKSKSN